MKTSVKYILVGFSVLCIGISVRMVVDPEYREQLHQEQVERERAEQARKEQAAQECEKTRNLSPEQWYSMSQLLQSTIATECRPSFAPDRTVKEQLNGAGRASSRVRERTGSILEYVINKPF